MLNRPQIDLFVNLIGLEYKPTFLNSINLLIINILMRKIKI